MKMSAEAWVACYAAIVATGALALEIRRWFESGPKLITKARANMVLIDGSETIEGLLVVDVVNRGDASTTIETLAILEFPNIWKRWRMKPSRSFIIPHPQPKGTPPSLPKLLSPGQKWTGIGHDRSDVTGDIQTGQFYAAVYTTDRDRPYLAHVPKRTVREELKDADDI